MTLRADGIVGRAFDVDLVLRRVVLGLDPVHALGRHGRADPVALSAIAVRNIQRRTAWTDDHERKVGVICVERCARRARVACQARFLARLRRPVASLRCLRIGFGVAHPAVAQVLRISDVRKVVLDALVAPDPVELAAVRELARQQPPRMDLVDHRRHRQHVAAVGVGRAGVVAHHAVLHVDAAAAVQRQLLVAGVAGVDHRDDLRLGRVRDRDRVAVRVEGDVVIRIDANHLARRVGVAQLDRDAVRQAGFEHHAHRAGRVGDVGAERVGVVAVRVVDQLVGLPGRFRVGGRLQRLRQHRRAARPGADIVGAGRRLDARDVALPAVGVAVRSRDQLGDREAHVDERQPLLDRAVREHREIDHRRARDRDGRHACGPAAPRTRTTELVDVSLAGFVAAAAMACVSRSRRTEQRGCGCAGRPLSPPPPHPPSAASRRAVADHHSIERFMDDSITSSVPPCAAFAVRPCA